ncbi:MAG: hypothetical protein U0984_08515 [Prosthecobacter sp.]|nr:hypothetical protein [Prosthecobacter sp.]
MSFARLKVARPIYLWSLGLSVLVQWFGVPVAHAQYGVSPSQTGLFFDDLRARQKAEKAATDRSGLRDGDVTYDYDSGVYRDNPEAPMGQRTADYEDAREMSRPAVHSGSAAYSARGAGDYTNYAGQYTSPTGFFAPTYVSDPYLSGRRNLKVGPINIGFGLYQGFEYNDNANRSGGDNLATPLVDESPISDVISSTMLSIDANYQITRNNRLSITTALGFDHYFEHPELAPYGNGGFVLNVLPGSTLAFDIKAGPVFITIYDRMPVRPASRNDFALGGNQVFGVFQNDVGIAANWRVNSDWTLAVNLMHSNSDAVESSFDKFSRVTDSLHGSLTFSPNGTWSVGMEGGSTVLNYKEQLNNDGLLNNIGAFVVLPVSNTTYFRLAAGYQSFTFNSPIPAAFIGPIPTRVYINTGDQSDLSDFYYTLTLSNKLNSRVSQSFSLGHESALNVTSNYVTADFANYGLAIIAWKGSRITLSGYVEDASSSGGVFAQDTFQYGFDGHIAHRLTSKWSMGVGYHYGMTDAFQAGQGSRPGSFEQHAFNIDFNYAMSAKANLVFGYRYYFTHVIIGGTGDFSQNRLMMAVNYNF